MAAAINQKICKMKSMAKMAGVSAASWRHQRWPGGGSVAALAAAAGNERKKSGVISAINGGYQYQRMAAME
jgi:hypothetical protein